MDGFLITQYLAKEQAELKVKLKVNVPGLWFNNLRGQERKKNYKVMAYDHEKAHRFLKKGATAAQTCPAVRFLSNDDVLEDINSGKFIIPLDEWNRNRYSRYTYKDNRDAEMPYIQTAGQQTTPALAEATSEPKRPPCHLLGV